MKKTLINDYLAYLKLEYMQQNCRSLAKEAAQKSWDYLNYLETLLEGEALLRKDKNVQRRIHAARFPMLKTLDEFLWDFPEKINRLQVQNLFRLEFISEKANVAFLGNVGLGKTHLAIALGYAACLKGYRVLFTTAIDMINTLQAAQKASSLQLALKKYLKPDVLIIDELGYLPIDRKGANLLFCLITRRYQNNSIIFTTNKAFNTWGSLFDNDEQIASAALDRLLHKAEVIFIEGKSFRMRDKLKDAVM